jgi:hypothetical protein
MDTQIVRNFLTSDEVKFLLSYYDSKPYTAENIREYQGRKIINNRHKNSEYDLTTSPVHQLIYPKLKEIIGMHQLDAGSLVESHFPFQIHLDTHKTFEDKHFYQHTEAQKCLDIAVLISLNEDPSFKTVMFDYYADAIDLKQIPSNGNMNTQTSVERSEVNLDHFTNQQLEFIQNLKISRVYNWSAGSVIVWPRRQLHCSSNFYPSGNQKKAIVLFL